MRKPTGPPQDSAPTKTPTHRPPAGAAEHAFDLDGLETNQTAADDVPTDPEPHTAD